MKRIINEYIDYTKKSIKQYMKLIFEEHVDNDIVDEFLITYINSRYYNIYTGKSSRKSFYTKITEELEKKYSKILDKYKEKAKKEKITIDLREEKIKIMSATKEIFELLLVWDNVKNDQDGENVLIENSIISVEKIRKKYYNYNYSSEFREKLNKKIKEDILKKDVYLDNLGSDVFKLKLTKNKKNHNIYYADLEQNIVFPMLYSKEIIEEIFNESVIADECLKVQFALLSTIVISDIIKGNFKDIYIVTLPDDLLNKKTKLENILENINTQVLQDKIYLKIYYNDFAKNKKTIYKLVNMGYKFAIEIDKHFTNFGELEKLKLFEYILLNDKLKIGKELQNYMDKYDNILEK